MIFSRVGVIKRQKEGGTSEWFPTKFSTLPVPPLERQIRHAPERYKQIPNDSRCLIIIKFQQSNDDNIFATLESWWLISPRSLTLPSFLYLYYSSLALQLQNYLCSSINPSDVFLKRMRRNLTLELFFLLLMKKINVCGYVFELWYFDTSGFYILLPIYERSTRDNRIAPLLKTLKIITSPKTRRRKEATTNETNKLIKILYSPWWSIIIRCSFHQNQKKLSISHARSSLH